MKKILSIVLLSMVCLLSGCSFLHTLDTKGNVKITIDWSIEATVTDYNVSTLGATATVSFTNTSKKTKEFNLTDTKCFNVDDESKMLLVVPASLSSSTLTNEIEGNKTIKYTFTVTKLTADLDDYKISFMLNGAEVFIALKNE